MMWRRGIVNLFRSKLVTKFAPRAFCEKVCRAFAQTYQDMTILIEPSSSFLLCRFVNCRFQLAGETSRHSSKTFSNCTFEDCDFGMPLREFLTYAQASTIDEVPQVQLAQRLALEEAVRRIRRRHPYLTAQCLDPCCRDEREFIAQWVSAEYRNIIAEAA